MSEFALIPSRISVYVFIDKEKAIAFILSHKGKISEILESGSTKGGFVHHGLIRKRVLVVYIGPDHSTPTHTIVHESFHAMRAIQRFLGIGKKGLMLDEETEAYMLSQTYGEIERQFLELMKERNE